MGKRARGEILKLRPGPSSTSLQQYVSYDMVCNLFKGVVSNSDCVVTNDWVIVNWRARGMKRCRPDLSCYPRVCLEVLGEKQEHNHKDLKSR